MKIPCSDPAPLKKATVKITLKAAEPRNFSLAPPPRTVRPTAPPTPAEFAVQSRMHQIMACSVHADPYRQEISRAQNQFLCLLVVLVASTVWASFITKMIVATTATSQLVINGYTIVAFAPAAAVICLIICTIWSTRVPRRAIQEIYAAHNL